ncbi:predicted protein [Arabidopsis lyrata subsp. lyrata]|uniref:Predicted protein n=1 Tax=Arabidopsis lyrata subsp. lyrata TaxID=81972 RepID=D7KP14_ARALL|nr:predicted protein [Arabidopsis lyrata subsp. lyrata]
MYGFLLALQLLAYQNISGLLDKISGSSDPSNLHGMAFNSRKNLSLNEVHLVDRVPDETPSKSKASTSRQGKKRKFELIDDAQPDDIKEWVNSEFVAVRHELAETIKKLTA